MESLWSYRHPTGLNVIRPLRLLVSMSFFSSCFRFVAILPSAAFDTLVKSEVGKWVGICEIVQGCQMYGRVFFFSLENLVLGYLHVEEFE
jgi:hypothetical protein